MIGMMKITTVLNSPPKAQKANKAANGAYYEVVVGAMRLSAFAVTFAIGIFLQNATILLASVFARRFK